MNVKNHNSLISQNLFSLSSLVTCLIFTRCKTNNLMTYLYSKNIFYPLFNYLSLCGFQYLQRASPRGSITVFDSLYFIITTFRYHFTSIYSARSVFVCVYVYAYAYYYMRNCPYVRVCVCLSLCMRHKNEFGTQMKNTHTFQIRIRIRIRDAHTRLVKNTLRALYSLNLVLILFSIESTVGYGDIYPDIWISKLYMAIMIIVDLIVIPTQVK